MKAFLVASTALIAGSSAFFYINNTRLPLPFLTKTELNECAIEAGERSDISHYFREAGKDAWLLIAYPDQDVLDDDLDKYRGLYAKVDGRVRKVPVETRQYVRSGRWSCLKRRLLGEQVNVVRRHLDQGYHMASFGDHYSQIAKDGPVLPAMCDPGFTPVDGNCAKWDAAEDTLFLEFGGKKHNEKEPPRR